METQKSITYASFDGARLMHYSHADRALFKRLEHRVPDNLHGVFQVMTSPDGNKVAFEGVRIQGDAPLKVLNRLYALATGTDQNHPLANYHKPHRVKDFSKEQLQSMLFSKEPFHGSGALIQAKRSYNHPLEKHSIDAGTYETSCEIDQAVTMGELGKGDLALLEKIRAAVPLNCRGFFICDFIRDADNKFVLQHLAIDPQAATEALSAGMQHALPAHFHRTKVLTRENLLQLGSQLPAAATAQHL